jgi:hypothetical protein
MQVKQVLKKNKWQKDYVLTYHKGKEKKRRKFGIKFFSKPAKHDIETS